MKTITPGVPFGRQLLRGHCVKCEAVFEAQRHELNVRAKEGITIKFPEDGPATGKQYYSHCTTVECDSTIVFKRFYIEPVTIGK